MCMMHVHGRVYPRAVVRSGRALARTLSNKLLAAERHFETRRTHLSGRRGHQGCAHRRVGAAIGAARKAAKGGKVLRAEKRGAWVVGWANKRQ